MKRDLQLTERFWALRRRIRFSSTETVLYLCLLRLCREAEWPAALRCPNAVLCREAGIDESTLLRARRELIRKGVIRYAGSTAGSRPTCYMLAPLPPADGERECRAADRKQERRMTAGEQVRSVTAGEQVRSVTAGERECRVTAGERECRAADRKQERRMTAGEQVRSVTAGERECRAADRAVRPGMGAQPDTVPCTGTETGGLTVPAKRLPAPKRSWGPRPAEAGMAAGPGRATGAAETSGETDAASSCWQSGGAENVLASGTAGPGRATGATETSGETDAASSCWQSGGAENVLASGTAGSGRATGAAETSGEMDAASSCGQSGGAENALASGTAGPGRATGAADVAEPYREAGENGSAAPDFAGGQVQPHPQAKCAGLQSLSRVRPGRPAGKGAGKEGDYGGNRGEQRDYPKWEYCLQPDYASVTVLPGRGAATLVRRSAGTADPADAGDKQAAVCPKGGGGQKTAGCPNSGGGQKTAGCPNCGGGQKTAGCPKGGGGQKAAVCPKGGGGQKTAGCPNSGGGQKTAGCPNSGGGQYTAGCPNSGGGQKTAGRRQVMACPAAAGSPDFPAVPCKEAPCMLPDGLPDESSGSLPARIHDAAAIAALGSPDILPDILPDVLPDGLPVPAGGPATGASKGKRVQSGKLPKSRSGERAGATGGDRTAESGSAGSSTPPTAARKGTGEAAAEPSGGRYPVPGGAGLPAETADRTVPGKRRRRVRADLDLSFVRRDLLTVFGEWLAYKQARGNGYRTQASLEACYERLMTLSDGDPATAREVVRQSVANNWSGIFELRKHHACHTHTAYPGAVPGTAVPTHTDGYTDTL